MYISTENEMAAIKTKKTTLLISITPEEKYTIKKYALDNNMTVSGVISNFIMNLKNEDTGETKEHKICSSGDCL